MEINAIFLHISELHKIRQIPFKMFNLFIYFQTFINYRKTMYNKPDPRNNKQIQFFRLISISALVEDIRNVVGPGDVAEVVDVMAQIVIWILVDRVENLDVVLHCAAAEEGIHFEVEQVVVVEYMNF